MSIPGLNMLSIVFEAIFLFTNYVSRLNSLDWVLCPCQKTLLLPLLCNKWMTWRRHVNARFQEISFLHTWPLVYYVGRRISFRLSALNPLRSTQSVIVIKERGRDRCQRRRCQFFPSPIYWLDPIQSTPFFIAISFILSSCSNYYLLRSDTNRLSLEQIQESLLA